MCAELLALLLSSCLTFQNSQPGARMEWTSPHGRFVVRIDAKQKPGRYVDLICAEVLGDRQTREVWQHRLPRPDRAYVHDAGTHVVLVEPARHARDKTAVVLLGADGIPQRRFCLADLFARRDIEELLKEGTDKTKPPWYSGGAGGFVRGREDLAPAGQATSRPITGATSQPTSRPASSSPAPQRAADHEYFVFRLRTGKEAAIDLGPLAGLTASRSPAPQSAAPQAAVPPAQPAPGSSPARLTVGEWRDGSTAGFCDGVIARQLVSPADLDNDPWTCLEDGRLFIRGRVRHGSTWEQTIFAVDPDTGQKSTLLHFSYDPQVGTGVYASGIVPNPSGTRACVYQIVFGGVDARGLPKFSDPIAELWNLATGDKVRFPDTVAPRGWLDETHLLVTDRVAGVRPRGVRIYDTETGQLSPTIPAGAEVGKPQVCGPDCVVYVGGPSPERPYNALYFATQYAMKMLHDDPDLGAALLDELRNFPAPGEVGGSESDPVRPYADPHVPFGSLRLLDFSDPENPVEVVLADPFSIGADFALSPDRRFVAFNRQSGPARAHDSKFVLLDTWTRRWKVVGPHMARVHWRPNSNRVIGFTDGPNGDQPTYELDLTDVMSELAGQ